MPSYRITEPHPTALPNHRIHTGRGGAGNTIRIAPNASSSASTTSSTSSTSTTTQPSTKAKASTGRGGAGNIHPSSSLSSYSISDALDLRAAHEQGHELWHVGRGGAGNFASSAAAARKMSSGSEDSNAGSEGGSVKSGFLGRLSGAFDRR